MGQMLLVIAAVVVAVLLLLTVNKSRERFFVGGDISSTSIQWVTDNPMLVPRAVPAKNITALDVTRWPEVLDAAPGLPADLSKVSTKTVMLIADPQDAATTYSGLPQMLMPRGHFLALTSLTTGFGMECGYQWVGKTIGYTDRHSLLFILSVLHSHRISPKAVRLVNVPSAMWGKLEAILGSTLHVIVTYAIPESVHMLLLIRQNINIMGFQRIQEARLRLTMPSVTVEQVSLVDIVEGARARVLARERTSKLPTMQLVAVVLYGPTPEQSSIEGFVSQPEHRCFGDDKIFTRTACESPYDVSGMPKPFRTVWDRKCSSDSDCPYKTGARGGCDTNTGECEMPVGARRLSYRQFDTRPPFQPFCYNSDAWDLTGCSKITRPDWAFAGDKRTIDLRPTANTILLDSRVPPLQK